MEIYSNRSYKFCRDDDEFVLQTKWELQGLSALYKDPNQIKLDVRGTVYPERKGKHSWLKNEMEMEITFCASPATAFIPESVLQSGIELVRLPLHCTIHFFSLPV